MAAELGNRVGERIRSRRKQLGLNQRQLAARMPSEAVDHQRISDWERGINTPSDRYQAELVEALGLDDVGYFYAEDSPDLMAVLDSDQTARRLSHIEEQLVLMAGRLTELVDWTVEQDLKAAQAEQQERETGGDESGSGATETG